MKVCVGLVALISLVLSGCGGGGGGGSSDGGVSPSVSLSVTGIAATGIAISGANVSIKCQAGNGSATTTASGAYSVLISGGALPCMLELTNPTDAIKLHSLATGEGNSVVANLTPLTELVTSRLLAQDPTAYFAAWSATNISPKISTAGVTAAQADVVVALAGTVDATTASSFISTPMVAATPARPNSGDPHDNVLDALKAKITSTQLAQVSAALAASANIDSVKLAVVSIAASSNANFASTPVSIKGINDPKACWFSMLSAVDFDGDGNKDLAAHFWCNQFDKAVGFNGPTPDVFKLFLNKKDHFEDGNKAIFGQADISLGGASRKVIQADLNGDGKVDLAYAINREDGRPIGLDTSVAKAQSVVLTSNTGGNYSLTQVGVPDWFHNVDIFQTSASTTSIVFAGLTNMSTQPFSLGGGVWSPSSFSLPHLSGLTYRFMKSSPLLKADDLIVSGGLGDAANLDLFIYSNGAWVQGIGYRPTVTANAVTMKGWNGDILSVNRIDIGGASYVGAGFDESCRLNKAPNAPQIFLGRFSGRRLPDKYAGEVVVETDMPLYNELMAFQVNNGKLEKIPLGLSEPISQDPFPFFDCLDINGDGYDDIVLSHQRNGGMPDVFVNDKNGGIKKVSSSVFPASAFVGSSAPQARGMIADMDGDGLSDLIIFGHTSQGHEIHFYKGTKKLVAN